FYQVTSLQKVQAGERESDLWEEFAVKYHNVQWGGFGGIPDFVKVDASEIAQEARRLYRANIYQFVDQVESQESIKRREIRRLAEPNFAGTGVAVYSDYVSSLAPEVNHGLARRGARAQAAEIAANDPRVVAQIASREDTNVQRDREIAKRANEALIAMGNAATAQLQAEGEDITSTVDDNVIKSVSEEIAYLGDWAGLMEVEQEKLRFGERLEEFMKENNDKLVSFFVEAIQENDVQNNATNTDTSIIEATETIETLHSYIVSRPLHTIGFSSVASHMFIATDARYPGDPNANIYSFGKNDDGNVGRMFDGTYKDDVGAWGILRGNFNPEGKAHIYTKVIPANNEQVIKLANSILEQDKYDLLGPNSNSAAQAIVDMASESQVTPPGIDYRRAPGYEDSDDIDFDSE
ncbi:hypothetical protein KKG16_01360, partial [Patescibacteria group bacterium]|nr:hypothetical protein [Patescibacteria group bacterium]